MSTPFGWSNFAWIKRGLLLFWALWYSVVVTTNVLNALQALGILPASFKFVSGNWEWINQTMNPLGVDQTRSDRGERSEPRERARGKRKPRGAGRKSLARDPGRRVRNATCVAVGSSGASGDAGQGNVWSADSPQLQGTRINAGGRGRGVRRTLHAEARAERDGVGLHAHGRGRAVRCTCTAKAPLATTRVATRPDRQSREPDRLPRRRPADLIGVLNLPPLRGRDRRGANVLPAVNRAAHRGQERTRRLAECQACIRRALAPLAE